MVDTHDGPEGWQFLVHQPLTLTLDRRGRGAALKRFAEGPRGRIGVARRHGARVIAGTDAGGNALVRHGDNAEELGMLVRTGFSSIEALAAATGHAATAVGLPDRGRVLAGCRADLVMLSCDPTTDVGVLTAGRGGSRPSAPELTATSRTRPR